MLVFDRSEIVTRYKTDEGFLIADAVLCRSGLQSYLARELGIDSDKTIIVYRPESEVFDKKAITSFILRPVTNGHPSVMLDQSNIKNHQVGSIGDNIYRDGDALKAKIIITDSKTISDIEAGKCELSCGYMSDYDFTAGKTIDGFEYDAIQRNIVGNHVAVVDSGRCGAQCRILDHEIIKEEAMDFTTIRLGNLDCKVSQCSAQIVQRYVADMSEELTAAMAEKEALTAQMTELEAKIKELEAAEAPATDECATEEKSADEESMEALKAENEALKEQVSQENMDKAIEKRMNLLVKAKSMDSSADFSGKTEKQIMLKALKAVYPNETMDSKSFDYIQARFDAAYAISGAQKTMDNAVVNAFSASKTNDAANAQAKWIERNKQRFDNFRGIK